jgi:hypothetical protein
MKACARVYAFSILFLCVGIFVGALAQRAMDEKQFGDEAIRLDQRIKDMQGTCDKFDRAMAEAEMWHSAFQACTAINSLAEKADHESAKRRTDRRRVLHGVTSSAAKPGAVSAHRYVPGAAVASNEGAAPVLRMEAR